MCERARVNDRPLQPLDGRREALDRNRTAHASPSPIQDMGGDHRRVHVCVAEPFLNGSDIIAILERMRGTRVPEGMTR